MSDTVRVHVTNSVFDCDTCANTIERVLEKTAGVEKVRIDDEDSQLEVGYDTAQIEEEAIRKIVEEWGYTSSSGG